MASSTHNPTVLLKRLLSLKDPCPLYLITDTVAQTARNSILNEFTHHSDDLKIVYVSFETLNKPAYATEFIEASKLIALSYKPLIAEIQKAIATLQSENSSSLVFCIIDNVNYVEKTEIANVVQSLGGPRVSLCVIYHRDNTEYEDVSANVLSQFPQSIYPSTYEFLKFIATNVLEVFPNVSSNKHVEDEEVLEGLLTSFYLPRGLNDQRSYELQLTNRRKSGRSLNFSFVVNSETHEYVYKMVKNGNDQSNSTTDPSFDGLTTFNLNTTNKQKHAREQVELPFLEAQTFNTGGAIVYEFEKDDDYDEEDPFEDPF